MHSVPSTVPAVRTCLTRKQSGRLTAEIILDLSINKTAPDIKTYTNKEDIQQAESLRLEVIGSRNQHNEEKHEYK